MDVLVVGAGLTGAMIAAQLAENGATVGVVDAQRVGQGATARALGLAAADPSSPHFNTTSRGLDLLRSLADRHKVHVQSCITLHLASTPEGRATLQRAAENHPNSRLEWATHPELLPRGFTEGLLAHDGIMVDLDRLLTKLLQHPRINVRQHTEILRLETRNHDIYAIAHEATFAAKKIVLAANAYVGLLSPYLGESVRVTRSALFASHPLREGSAAKYAIPVIVDSGRVMMAPAREGRVKAAAWQVNANDADPYDTLRAFLKRTDPHLTEQAENWLTSVTTSTEDGMPFAGKLSGDADGSGSVFYALGLGPFGLAWAPNVAGQIAGLVATA
jgi:glycine/D-amino acid oxidase-like deaminating enzyme